MYRPGTSISKAKVKNSSAEDGQYNKVQQEKMPTLQDYIKKRDWIGAVALLESERNVNIQVENSLWLAYCYFHMGEYRYFLYHAARALPYTMNSSARLMTKTITSTRLAAITHSAAMTMPARKHLKVQRLRSRPDSSSTLPTRRMTRKI
jgi:hypothetical protein